MLNLREIARACEDAVAFAVEFAGEGVANSAFAAASDEDGFSFGHVGLLAGCARFLGLLLVCVTGKYYAMYPTSGEGWNDNGTTLRRNGCVAGVQLFFGLGGFLDKCICASARYWVLVSR